MSNEESNILSKNWDWYIFFRINNEIIHTMAGEKKEHVKGHGGNN
jgi:hypothetical protein